MESFLYNFFNTWYGFLYLLFNIVFFMISFFYVLVSGEIKDLREITWGQILLSIVFLPSTISVVLVTLVMYAILTFAEYSYTINLDTKFLGKKPFKKKTPS